MGGALQRLEILIIGLILLLAGVVAIFLTFMRPPSPTAYIPTTPLPIATSAAATIGATQPIATQPAPTPPRPTAAAAESRAPALPARSSIQLPTINPDLWPQLLFGAAAIGVALTIRQWRRRRATLKMPQFRLPRAALPTIKTPRITIPTASAPTIAISPEPAAAPIVTHRAEDLEAAPPSWLIESTEAINVVKESVPATSAPAEPNVTAGPIELPVLAETVEPVEPEVAEVTPESSAITDNTPSSLGIIAEEQPEPLAILEILAAQSVDLPVAQVEVAQEIPQAEPITWSAEDRVLATAAALSTIWNTEGISSPVRSFDTAKTDGAHAVLVNIDIHPDDEATILNLSQLLNIQHPKWRASWRHDTLTIEIPADGPPPPAGGPLIAPVLDHGRGHKMTRFYPLATWRHLGIYGANALHALHALLSSMLYTQPPANLALAILDQGEITPLYRDVPHLVTPPGDPQTILEALASVLRRSSAHNIRPLALVMVEPDSATLARLHTLLMRLRNQPAAPIHLITAQTQLHSAGREIYALLPALITAGGHGSCSWLPGQGDWPKSGAARLAGRGMRIEGRPHLMDESTIASALISLQRSTAGELPPVLWDNQSVAHQAANSDLRSDTPTPTTHRTTAHAGGITN